MKNAVDFEEKMTQFVINLREWLKDTRKTMSNREVEGWIETAVNVFEKKGYVPGVLEAICYLKKWFDLV